MRSHNFLKKETPQSNYPCGVVVAKGFVAAEMKGGNI